VADVYFQSIEMMLRKPRGHGKCLVAVKMMLKEKCFKIDVVVSRYTAQGKC